MAKNKFITDNEFYCVKCGRKGLPVIRQRGKEREAGHLKKLFCLNCKIETNHVECQPNTKYTKADFQVEFEYGNFDENGNRKQTYGELRNDIHNGTAKKEKTIPACGSPSIG